MTKSWRWRPKCSMSCSFKRYQPILLTKHFFPSKTSDPLVLQLSDIYFCRRQHLLAISVLKYLHWDILCLPSLWSKFKIIKIKRMLGLCLYCIGCRSWIPEIKTRVRVGRNSISYCRSTQWLIAWGKMWRYTLSAKLRLHKTWSGVTRKSRCMERGSIDWCRGTHDGC